MRSEVAGSIGKGEGSTERLPVSVPVRSFDWGCNFMGLSIL